MYIYNIFYIGGFILKNIFTEKFMEVIKYEGAVSLVTWSTIGVNVSNTWNSYLRVPRDGRILIPA